MSAFGWSSRFRSLSRNSVETLAMVGSESFRRLGCRALDAQRPTESNLQVRSRCVRSDRGDGPR